LNWREHPRLALAGLTVVAVALIFFLTRNFGCGDSTAHTSASSAGKATGKKDGDKKDATPPKPLVAPPGKHIEIWDGDPVIVDGEPPKPRVPPPTQKPKVPDGRVDSESSAAPAVEKPVRPENITDWRRDDFYSAKRDDDRRLIEAVARLGKKQFADKEATAELLTRLLESGVDDPFVESSSHGSASANSTVNPKLTEALVAALATNRTPTARRTLERLVAGTLKTTDPAVAAVAALKSLAEHRDAESEELLFGIIAGTATASEVVGDLRPTAFTMVGASASATFRLRLARHAVAAETPQSLFDQIWKCLGEAKKENCEAQTVFYQSDRLDEKTRQSLEPRFVEQGSAVLARLLKIPAATPTETSSEESSGEKPSPKMAMSAENAQRAALLQWNSAFASAVQGRLRAVYDLEQGARLVRLAATIPSQSMRVALLQVIEKNWEGGPKGLQSLASTDGPLCEPGFLLVVKKLPRKNAAIKARAGNPSSARPSKIAAELEARERQDKLAREWMAFSGRVTLTMCGRFHAAALAKNAGTSEAEADLPFKPHPNAEIAFSYRVDWPEGLGFSLAGVSISPLRVRYARIEQKAKPSLIASYYRRQLTGCGEHTDERGVWLDALMTDKQRGAVQSVDVLITKPKKDTPLVLNEEQQLIVEILSVKVESTRHTSSEAVSSHGM
jgi:hypothetical protein